jgi:hypothetical protein
MSPIARITGRMCSILITTWHDLRSSATDCPCASQGDDGSCALAHSHPANRAKSSWMVGDLDGSASLRDGGVGVAAR